MARLVALSIVPLLALHAPLSGCSKSEKREEPAHSNPGDTSDAAESNRPSLPAAPEPTRESPSEPAPRSVPDLPRPHELGAIDPDLRGRPVQEQQAYLLRLVRAYEHLSDANFAQFERIVSASEWLSFGNPAVSRAALPQEACLKAWSGRSLPRGDERCGHRNMVRVAESGLCVDALEFPNVLCEYPVVWTRASEAGALCESLGKRLCDAHEWEGACAGEVRAPESEYEYARLPKGVGPEYRRARRILMEGWHNLARPLVWAYGSEKNHALCGTGSKKSPGCDAVSYQHCGTNDYPAGSFPDCRTPSGIFDQHGNVAEHMSFPLYPEDLGGKGSTEMKGSWFLFAREETHPDDCRWRAKNWHTTKVSDPNSHRNYHLGFRCCEDIPVPPSEDPSK